MNELYEVEALLESQVQMWLIEKGLNSIQDPVPHVFDIRAETFRFSFTQRTQTYHGSGRYNPNVQCLGLTGAVLDTITSIVPVERVYNEETFSVEYRSDDLIKD